MFLFYVFYFFFFIFFFFQAEDGIRDGRVTGGQTCALPIAPRLGGRPEGAAGGGGAGPRRRPRGALPAGGGDRSGVPGQEGGGGGRSAPAWRLAGAQDRPPLRAGLRPEAGGHGRQPVNREWRTVLPTSDTSRN